MADVISHQASECMVCKKCVLHISEVAMDNNDLYLNAVGKQQSHWIPMHKHQWELQHAATLAHDLEDCQDKIDALKRHNWRQLQYLLLLQLWQQPVLTSH
jgi:hypothetical protein